MSTISHNGTDRGRTSREQNIEQVAGIIADWEGLPAYDPDWDDAAEATKANTAGWTIEVRYDYQTYITDEDYTRVEGLSLSDADLTRALVLAAEWRSAS